MEPAPSIIPDPSRPLEGGAPAALLLPELRLPTQEKRRWTCALHHPGTLAGRWRAALLRRFFFPSFDFRLRKAQVDLRPPSSRTLAGRWRAALQRRFFLPGFGAGGPFALALARPHPPSTPSGLPLEGGALRRFLFLRMRRNWSLQSAPGHARVPYGSRTEFVGEWP